MTVYKLKTNGRTRRPLYTREAAEAVAKDFNRTFCNSEPAVVVPVELCGLSFATPRIVLSI
jgi:hypothetical protein